MSVNKEMIKKQREAAEAVKREEAIKQTPVSDVNTQEAILEDFSLDDLEQVDVRHKNVGSSIKGTGCLTIINHERCGRRVHLANSIWRDLGCPPFLKVFLKPEKMIIMADSDTGIAVKFDRTMELKDAVKDYNGKIVLYATETVKRVTADWQLQFDSNCCYTGGTYKKCTVNGMPAIVISKDNTGEVAKASKEGATENNIADETGSAE